MKYFDWAATSPISEKALEIYNEYSIKYFYNCSSIYKEGIENKKRLDSFREEAATLFQVDKNRIFWTSGATESNNIILSSFLNKKIKKNILYYPLEHPSILKPLKNLEKSGYTLKKIDVDKMGNIDIDKFKNLLSEDVQLVTVMAVQNEIGVVNDIGEIGRIIGDFSLRNNHKIWFHCDCAQATGKVEFKIDKNIDSASISFHKICGPKGCGLLFCKNEIEPIFVGGGQERGVRSGTEDLPAIAASMYALKSEIQNLKQNIKKTRELKKFLIAQLKECNGIKFIPDNKELLLSENFSPHILQISIPNIPSEIILRLLNDKKIIISNGSACSSNTKKKDSSALQEIKTEKNIIDSAIRISLSWATKEDDIKCLTDEIKAVIEKNSFLVKGK